MLIYQFWAFTNTFISFDIIIQISNFFLGYLFKDRTGIFSYLQEFLFILFNLLAIQLTCIGEFLPAEKNFLRYALYLAFFPQFVAGPIVVAYEFLPQIKDAYKENSGTSTLIKLFTLYS